MVKIVVELAGRKRVCRQSGFRCRGRISSKFTVISGIILLQIVCARFTVFKQRLVRYLGA